MQRRRIIAFLFLIAVSFSLSCAQLTPPDLFPTSQIKAAGVLLARSTRYAVDDSLNSLGESKVRVRELNEEGRMLFNLEGLPTESKEWTETGLLKIAKFTYDKEGRKAGLTEIISSPDGKFTYMTTSVNYRYDAKGRLIEEKTALTDSAGKTVPLNTITWEYSDTAGYYIKTVLPAADTVPTIYRHLQFKSGAESISILRGETWNPWRAMEPDSTGRLSWVSFYNVIAPEDMKDAFRQEQYRYDQTGKLREKETFDTQGGTIIFREPVALESYQYNDKGLLQEIIYWKFDEKRGDHIPLNVVKLDYEYFD